MSEPVDGTPRRRRRRWPWVVGGVLVAVVGVGALAGVQTASAARDIKSHAATAQDSISAAKAALEAGDVGAARTDVAQARSAVDAARAAADIAPLTLAGSLPVVNAPVQDIDHLLDAAGSLVDASEQLVEVYAAAAGKGGGTKIFSDGVVNLARVKALSADIEDVDAQLVAAIDSLEQVQGTFPGTGALAEARDKALAEAQPLHETFAALTPALPLLPAALGETKPTRYLVAILNPGELRASGGAPLSVLLLGFDKGRMTIMERGQTSYLIPYEDSLVRWEHVTESPFPTGDQISRFVNSNVHPDFRKAGVEMIRGWAASGKPSVDGVITVDPVAIAAVLKETGPITTKEFGQITGDNLAQKLLIDAYREFNSATGERQSINDEIAGAMIDRLTGGDQLLSVVRALASTAPGRHLQIHVQDEVLQDIVVEQGFGGALDEKAIDPIAVFTQNINASKVDVFQRREIEQLVTLTADGGATVERRVTLHNETPDGAFFDKTQKGYFTAYAGNNVMVYRPPTAVTAGAVSVKGDARSYPDGLGGYFYRWRGLIRPKGSQTFVLRYTLPPGTYPDGVYRGLAQPQPMLKPATLTVRVTGADGTQAAPVTVTVDRPIDIVVPTG